MNYKKLSKEVLSVIKPPIWDSCYYVSKLTRKAYEKAIPQLLKDNIKYKILDYGCGARPYEYLFEGYINKYVGVDVGNNPKADINIEPGENLPVNDNDFDIVLSSQVLEHVKDVNHYISECKRILMKDGYLLLSTHGTWQFHASPYDYYRWTILGLKEIMENNGFSVENYHPVLGQFALTSQLRLNFYSSTAGMIGFIGKLFLLPVSFIYQLKMIIEDAVTPKRVKERDSAIYLLILKRK